jgi:hypothetical protein
MGTLKPLSWKGKRAHKRRHGGVQREKSAL